MPGRRSTSRAGSATGAVVNAVPYDVTCTCGQRHAGARDAEYQVLECDACGRRLFVLPECPYPEIDESAPAVPRVRSDRLQPVKKTRKRPAEARHDERGTRPAEAGHYEPEELLTVPRRRIVTPLRLVAVGIVIIFGATGFWKYRQSVRTQAERDFREHADLGDAALKEHDFVTAYKEYRTAVAALEKLGRDDEKARHVRQMFRESRAASDLASKTLPEILEDVGKWSVADPKGWKQRFRSDYGGQWVVMDTLARRVTAKDGGEFVQIDFLQGVAGRPVDLLIAGTAFDSLKLDGTPKPAILAVQLQRCEFRANGDRWVVTFNSETAFLWSNYESLRTLGFPVAGDAEEGGVPNDEVQTERVLRDRLLMQSKLIGLSE